MRPRIWASVRGDTPTGRYARPIGNGLSQRLERAVRSDYGVGSVEAVLVRLAGIDLPLIDTEAGRERVQAAVVVVAAGNYSDFERAAAQAETDWRDVLVAARLANDDWPRRLDELLGERRAS